MCRTVTLVVIDDAGVSLGALPPFDVESPYWPDVVGVVAAARERFGLDVAVLRLLSAERPVPHGGAVTYLAQAGRVPAGLTTPIDVDLSPHPRRAEYAEPGGPAASLRWAAEELAERDRGPVVHAAQQRTWNLSAIWRLETPRGAIWLKQVPRFFAHEPTVLRWIAESGHEHLVPTLLAADGGRMLLDHVDGEDLYGADTAVCGAIAAEVHPVQLSAADQVDALIGLGVPDGRAVPLVDAITAVAAAYGGEERLPVLVAGLAERMARVAACGVPDTLVHGDLHPGNVRGDEHRRVVIDWGDSAVGHPAFDILRLTEDLSGPDAESLIDAWARRWRAAAPGCDPPAAVALLRPVAALRAAAAYAHFLANIEPAEHPYHAADVGLWLSRAVA